MSDLIIGIIVNVVSHLILNELQCVAVGLITTAAWDFIVLDAAELVILKPKVGLECFQGRGETKQGRVSPAQTYT